MFKNHFVKQLQSVELAGRPLPWTRIEEPPELICEVPPDKGRIVVHKEGFWWESSVEAPDEVPVFEPFAMEVAQAMEWVEQTLPKHRAEQIAQQQARAAEEAAEAARMAALRGKSLKRYWIDASDLEPERITYRAVIELEYAPFHAKKLKLRSGEVIDTDRKFYTPAMLAQQIGLNGAHVDVEQPLDFLDACDTSGYRRDASDQSGTPLALPPCTPRRHTRPALGARLVSRRHGWPRIAARQSYHTDTTG